MLLLVEPPPPLVLPVLLDEKQPDAELIIASQMLKLPVMLGLGPNITGSIYYQIWGESTNSSSATGAFSLHLDRWSNASYGSLGNLTDVTTSFNARSVSSIYNASTVQPKSAYALMIIKA